MSARHQRRVTGRADPARSTRCSSGTAGTGSRSSGCRSTCATARSLPNFTIEGYEHVTDALAAGKGVILALPHLGGWEWAAAWMAAQGHHMLAVVEPLRPAGAARVVRPPARGDRARGGADRSRRLAVVLRRPARQPHRLPAERSRPHRRRRRGRVLRRAHDAARGPGDAGAAHGRRAVAGRGVLPTGPRAPRRGEAADPGAARGRSARRHRPASPSPSRTSSRPSSASRPSSGICCRRTGRATANEPSLARHEDRDDLSRTRCRARAACRVRCSGSRANSANSTSTCGSSRPCDGPPPDPTIVSVGPTVEWESNGSIAPIAPGRATARRTAEALRTLEPDVVHLHEPIVPGPTVSALIGFNGPMVGTFHAAGEVPYQWLRPALRSLMMRLTFRVAVSESARETAAGNWTGAEYTVLWNGIEIDRIASAAPAPRRTTDGAVHRSPRTPQGTRGVARRVGRHRSRGAAAGGRGRAADRRAEATRRPATSSGSAPSPTHPRDALLRGATVFCAPSLRGESFGVVLLEAMAAGAPIVASAIEGYQNVARAGQDALLVPPGDVAALRDALRRLLDDPALRARLVASGRERAEQFSMRKPGRALPRAVRPGARPGGLSGRPGAVVDRRARSVTESRSAAP